MAAVPYEIKPNLHGTKKDPLNTKYAPKNSKGSVFGNFPGDFTIPSKSVNAGASSSGAAAATETLSKSQKQQIIFQKSHSGTGGATSSLNKGRRPPPPDAPKAGATHRRQLPATEFRRFYDRGDLPIAVALSSARGRRAVPR